MEAAERRSREIGVDMDIAIAIAHESVAQAGVDAFLRSLAK